MENFSEMSLESIFNKVTSRIKISDKVSNISPYSFGYDYSPEIRALQAIKESIKDKKFIDTEWYLN